MLLDKVICLARCFCHDAYLHLRCLPVVDRLWGENMKIYFLMQILAKIEFVYSVYLCIRILSADY